MARRQIRRLSTWTLEHPNTVKVINRWITQKDWVPPDFTYTSIAINKDYSSRWHRDRMNEGKSIAVACGKYQGGRFKYHRHDCRTMGPEDAEDLPHELHDIYQKPLIFDGGNAHGVEAFTGNRYSFILYNSKGMDKLTVEDFPYCQFLDSKSPNKILMRMLKFFLGGTTIRRASSLAREGLVILTVQLRHQLPQALRMSMSRCPQAQEALSWD